MKREPSQATSESDVEALYRSDLRRVVGLAYLLTGDAAFAEEAGQEAFARLIRNVATARQPAAYLTTVTLNLCRDRGRREVTLRMNPAPPPAVVGPPVLPRDVDDIWRAVQRLPQRHREAIILRYWADLSTAEIARLLRLRPGTTRSLLHRALVSLKEVLSDER